MSQIRLPVVLAAAGALTAAAAFGLEACSRRGDGPAPAPAPSPSGTPDPDPDREKKMREQAEKSAEEQRAKLDKDARGLLASCDARVYRPVRDSAVERAAGRIDVKAGSSEASYKFAFDVANPPATPVTFETVSEPRGWDADVTTDVRRWGVMACVSAYE